MATVRLLTLFDHWSTSGTAAPHGRLTALLRAAGADADALAAETLGARNRRLIVLHDDWVDGPIEAQVACAGCKAVTSFTVPKDAMRALPFAGDDTVVTITYRGRDLAYRVPTMADIEAVSASADVRLAMLDRCAAGTERVPAADLDAATIDAIEAAFDRADPLASIVVESACPDCGAALAASVDLAAFVATDLDRLHAALLRDVDTIASAYGWREDEILGLPADRRARYVAMIVDRGAGTTARRRVRPL